ncbi:hypothetical protein DRW48_02775 [Paracoccus suum]|uniref:Uncharacterized protein n=1 Tax=Paracoccus suum TaxID=2259340 RepID=A0A344PHA2_9RHOB|nr:hypothetical protein [Paracoccus suum]AXC48757.1 hypothetical protein DRW48_02775 [Paracoccus suum]
MMGGRRSTRLAAMLALLALPAGAQSVTPCGDGPRADTIAEPWEANTATYADGAIRLTAIDTVEPAGAPFYLMVQSPPLDELGLRRCRLVGEAEGSGFFGLDFAARRAEYQAGKGLVVTVPIKRVTPGESDAHPATLRLTINQSSGEITADAR